MFCRSWRECRCIWSVQENLVPIRKAAQQPRCFSFQAFRDTTACVCQGKVITASFNICSPISSKLDSPSELGHKNVGSIFIGYDASVPVV